MKNFVHQADQRHFLRQSGFARLTFYSFVAQIYPQHHPEFQLFFSFIFSIF